MATFHRMKDDERASAVIRCFVKGAPDQLLARAAAGARARWHALSRSTEVREPYLAENERLGAQGLRVMATGQRDFDPATFDPNADLLPLIDDLDAPGARRHRRSAAGRGARRHRARRTSAGIQVRMITGDHADHRRGDRAPARASRARRSPAPSSRAMSDDEADRRIDDIGVIARVAPEDKVHLVDILRAQGPHRGHDRRRRERRPGAQDGRHRRRDGHHRHRGLQGGRGDDPDRRQLRHDRQGRRAGPRPVRQPDALHPLPDGVPLRVHRHVPRREHLQHPRRRPVPAAADAVDQLHGRRLPGHRPGLWQAARGPHGGAPRGPRTSRSSPRRCSRWLVFIGLVDGRRHARGHRLGGRPRSTRRSPTRWAS